jgi:hypothetical protein
MRLLTRLSGGVIVASALALSATAASAQDWCGFQQKEHSRVQCGFSSMQECKQALSDKRDGDKTVTCLPDPASG